MYRISTREGHPSQNKGAEPELCTEAIQILGRGINHPV